MILDSIILKTIKMKSFILILSFALMTVSCGSQVYLDPTTLSTVVEKKEFDFSLFFHSKHRYDR